MIPQIGLEGPKRQALLQQCQIIHNEGAFSLNLARRVFITYPWPTKGERHGKGARQSIRLKWLAASVSLLEKGLSLAKKNYIFLQWQSGMTCKLYIIYILFSYFYILFSFLESAHQTAKKSLGLIDISHDCNHCFSKHSTAKWIACNMSSRA